VLRTATSINGWTQDSWTGPQVDWVRRGCARGTLTLPVHSDPTLFPGVTQQIRISGTTAPFVVSLPSTASKNIVVHLVPQNGVCRVHLDVSPTRRPVDVPALNNPDSRQLGVLIAGFEYTPRA
jgi:hypothetical protein